MAATEQQQSVAHQALPFVTGAGGAFVCSMLRRGQDHDTSAPFLGTHYISNRAATAQAHTAAAAAVAVQQQRYNNSSTAAAALQTLASAVAATVLVCEVCVCVQCSPRDTCIMYVHISTSSFQSQAHVVVVAEPDYVTQPYSYSSSTYSERIGTPDYDDAPTFQLATPPPGIQFNYVRHPEGEPCILYVSGQRGENKK